MELTDELFDDVRYGISYETAQRHLQGELTDERKKTAELIRRHSIAPLCRSRAPQ